MNFTTTISQRLITAAFAVFMLISAGAPIARAGDDDDRRGGHGRRDRDRDHDRERGHDRDRDRDHRDRDRDRWGRGGRCERPRPCRRPDWDYYCPRHCQRHHRHHW
jgi:Ni/Co efflux regulator RcnB